MLKNNPAIRKFYISCPNDGGLYLFANQKLSLIKQGNIRGMTLKGSDLYFVDGQTVKNLQDDNLFYLPKIFWHDIRYHDGYFYLMATEYKQLYQVDESGKTIRLKNFEDCYWPNCCVKSPDGLIVFLSAKRPYSKSKIIFLDCSLDIKWEYNCFDYDEIHSPFLINNDLYWCRSNTNRVVKASIDRQLKDASEVIVNYDGYTRGLFLKDDLLILGTSENRHAENSSCQSNMQQGCVSFYKNGKLYDKIILPHKEVYDIC
jgi:hypothetical protein